MDSLYFSRMTVIVEGQQLKLLVDEKAKIEKAADEESSEKVAESAKAKENATAAATAKAKRAETTAKAEAAAQEAVVLELEVAAAQKKAGILSTSGALPPSSWITQGEGDGGGFPYLSRSWTGCGSPSASSPSAQWQQNGSGEQPGEQHGKRAGLVPSWGREATGGTRASSSAYASVSFATAAS